MADTGNVCVKIISANNVVGGRAIVGVDICGNHKYLDRLVGTSIETSEINDRLTGRFDNKDYYTA